MFLKKGKKKKTKNWSWYLEKYIIQKLTKSHVVHYIVSYHTCDCKTKVWCNYGFGQTTPQNLVLKIAQNCTEPHHEYPVVTLGIFVKVVTKKLWIYKHYNQKKKKKNSKNMKYYNFFLLTKRKRKNGLKRDKVEIENIEMRVIK